MSEGFGLRGVPIFQIRSKPLSARRDRAWEEAVLTAVFRDGTIGAAPDCTGAVGNAPVV